MTIEERAFASMSTRKREQIDNNAPKEKFIGDVYINGYCNGAKEQRQIDIEKAVKVYTNELRQTIDLLNKVGEMYDIDKLGEILSFEGCVKDFRKAMEEQV